MVLTAPTSVATALSPLFFWGSGGVIPTGTRVDIFTNIFTVFMVLGTLVGIVVIGYMFYLAYQYRDDGGEAEDADSRLGELPQGGGKGKKLFLSFAISAIIVITLIIWTYGTLLYVEQVTAQEDEFEDQVEIEVEGYQFGWEFTYENGYSTDGELRVPEDRPILIRTTSRDVMHNFGISALRVKSDAVPGMTTETWFEAEEPGEYTAECFEFCGAGHSHMTATVIVMEQEEYEEWYENTEPETGGDGA